MEDVRRWHASCTPLCICQGSLQGSFKALKLRCAHVTHPPLHSTSLCGMRACDTAHVREALCKARQLVHAELVSVLCLAVPHALLISRPAEELRARGYQLVKYQQRVIQFSESGGRHLRAQHHLCYVPQLSHRRTLESLTHSFLHKYVSVGATKTVKTSLRHTL